MRNLRTSLQYRCTTKSKLWSSKHRNCW